MGESLVITLLLKEWTRDGDRLCVHRSFPWRDTLAELRKSGQVVLSMEGGVSRIKSAGRARVVFRTQQRLSCCVTVNRDGRVRDKESRFLSHCDFH